ncbi:MAG TPA: 8-oxo-dGTP diphosphatase MutT [Woeseiaceae bacterium]|nr:8-oxo-dGTP diphosphatase MutT [Woeseiaceae bacterium]
MIRLNVVAGVLRDTNGRVLISERLEEGPFHGLWEFPGGKIARGETAESALVRELAEEIGIDVVASSPFMRLAHDYPDRHVAIQFFFVNQWYREPAGLEGQRLQWLAPVDLSTANLLPADLPVVDALVRLARIQESGQQKLSAN